MEKPKYGDAEKPKRKIDRSKKKRKLRSRVDFSTALGHKDLRTKSHAASHKRLYGKRTSDIIELPENKTYTMPSSDEDKVDIDEFDEEYSDEETEELSNNVATNADIDELEKEFFSEMKLDNDKDSNSKLSNDILHKDSIEIKSEKQVQSKDANLENKSEDNLEALLNLSETVHTPVVKTLKFSPTVSKPGWKSGDKNISALETYLDSILDDM